MKFIETRIAGAWEIQVEPHVDERGLFARTFCSDTYAAKGLVGNFPQCSVSWNRYARTLRGLHYQTAPKSEAKVVRAISGRVFDVAVDLRPESPSFLKWTSVILDAGIRNALYIPEGCAHGFLTLQDNCEIDYMISERYNPEHSGVVRWNDPAFAIDWPVKPEIISIRDSVADDFL